jgi:outer membrane lipoprotein-sorting protein
MDRKTLYKIIIPVLLLFTYAIGFNCLPPAFAAGNLRKLKGISDSMGRMEQHGQAEGKNYEQACSFLNGPDIEQGIKGSDLIKICGEPVAKADNGLRWVYKPPTSTLFKGEKIYFYFDENQKLADWEYVIQK